MVQANELDSPGTLSTSTRMTLASPEDPGTPTTKPPEKISAVIAHLERVDAKPQVAWLADLKKWKEVISL